MCTHYRAGAASKHSYRHSRTDLSLVAQPCGDFAILSKNEEGKLKIRETDN